MNHWSDEPDALDPFRSASGRNARGVFTITHIPREAPAVADLARRSAALADRVADLEGLLADERREVARMRAVVAGGARKARWWETVSAFVSDRLDRLSDWTLGWYL